MSDDRRSGTGRRADDFETAVALAVVLERVAELGRRIELLEQGNRERVRTALTAFLFPIAVGVIVGLVLGLTR